MERESLHCGELIKRINDILGANANKALKEDDMTTSQIKMLITISETKEECITLKELEKYFGVAQATIAGTASRLEKKEMIESFYEPKDKRVKHVRLTDKGRKMCKHARKTMLEKERWFLSSLNDSEKEEFHRLLQKVYEDLKEKN
ncbi:MAG: MarR family winged helix-turn-helix transcriptional regulator [Lachnospiraceae bacterium]